ncbi:hypothetical protein JXD20_00120 [Candidatus Peregrinibacteria bacterium]|nr:hypothetical protein [Candidatus Peregrinibacteria bacterium]
MQNKNKERDTAQDLSDAQSERTGDSYIRLAMRRLMGRGVRLEVASVFGDRFSKMYDLSKRTHERFELQSMNGLPFPSLAQVSEAFTREELIFARSYQQPMLVLTPPGKTDEDLFQILAERSGLGGQMGLRLSNAGPMPSFLQEEYGAFITEGSAKIIPCGDRRNSSLLRRCKKQVNNYEQGECGMRGDIYAMLAMQSLMRGDLIDKENYTVFDGEEIIGGKYVPVGHCEPHRPIREWLPAKDETRLRARFRRVIGGRFVNPEL